MDSPLILVLTSETSIALASSCCELSTVNCSLPEDAAPPGALVQRFKPFFLSKTLDQSQELI